MAVIQLETISSSLGKFFMADRIACIPPALPITPAASSITLGGRERGGDRGSIGFSTKAEREIEQ